MSTCPRWWTRSSRPDPEPADPARSRRRRVGAAAVAPDDVPPCRGLPGSGDPTVARPVDDRTGSRGVGALLGRQMAGRDRRRLGRRRPGHGGGADWAARARPGGGPRRGGVLGDAVRAWSRYRRAGAERRQRMDVRSRWPAPHRTRALHRQPGVLPRRPHARASPARAPDAAPYATPTAGTTCTCTPAWPRRSCDGLNGSPRRAMMTTCWATVPGVCPSAGAAAVLRLPRSTSARQSARAR